MPSERLRRRGAVDFALIAALFAVASSIFAVVALFQDRTDRNDLRERIEKLEKPTHNENAAKAKTDPRSQLALEHLTSVVDEIIAVRTRGDASVNTKAVNLDVRGERVHTALRELIDARIDAGKAEAEGKDVKPK